MHKIIKLYFLIQERIQDEWENAFVPNPSSNNLTNVTIGSQGAITNPLVNQQILRYNSTTGNWSNSNDDIYNSNNSNSTKSSLIGVDFGVISPANKDVVMFNGKSKHSSASGLRQTKIAVYIYCWHWDLKIRNTN